MYNVNNIIQLWGKYRGGPRQYERGAMPTAIAPLFRMTVNWVMSRNDI